MTSKLLVEYELWKRRQSTWPAADIKNYFADGIELGEKLLKVGCTTDRAGLDIQEQVNILKAQLEALARDGAPEE